MSNKSVMISSLEEAINLGPPPEGYISIPVLANGSMEARLYTPGNTDTQTPHTRDEVYIVAKGSGDFFNGKINVPIQEGSFIFVPAGIEHRFLNYTNDFTVWVIFYGPEGGESNA